MNKRREILKLAGAATVWTVPSIKMISLPAHAMTSEASDVVFISKSINCDVDNRMTFTDFYQEGYFVFENKADSPLELLSLVMTITFKNGTSFTVSSGNVTTTEPFDMFNGFTFNYTNLPTSIEPQTQFAVHADRVDNSSEGVNACQSLEFSVSLILTTDAGVITVD